MSTIKVTAKAGKWVYEPQGERRKGGQMFGTAYLYEDGKFICPDIYMENKSVKGFTAAIVWSFYNNSSKQRKIQYRVVSPRFGINGKLLGTPKRSEKYATKIPAKALANTKYITAKAIHTPSNRTRKWLGQFLIAAIIEFLKSLGDSDSGKASIKKDDSVHIQY